MTGRYQFDSGLPKQNKGLRAQDCLHNLSALPLADCGGGFPKTSFTNADLT